MPPDEVLTMGRIGVDLYPEQIGVPLRRVRSFARFLGGSPSDVAVAAARYGRRAAVITRTGADGFGVFLHAALRGFGVDDRFVTSAPGLPTPLAFCEIFPPDHFPLTFYRYPKAPDLEIHPSELDHAAIRGAGVFWVTGTGLSAEPSRAATLTAPEARGRRDHTVLDLDLRPMFWASREQARHRYAEALALATVAIGNLDEVETAVGVRGPGEAAARLPAAGPTLAVIKRGPAGVLAATAETTVEVGPVAIETVNGLGAGDAFGGALCHGLLAGSTLERWCASPASPEPSSPRGSRAPTRCPPSRRSMPGPLRTGPLRTGTPRTGPLWTGTPRTGTPRGEAAHGASEEGRVHD